MVRRRWDDAEHLEPPVVLGEAWATDECATTAALSGLGPEWVVLSDLAWPGRTELGIDHVVLGPTGVFAITTQAWTGAVRLNCGVLEQNGRPQPHVTADLTEAASAVSTLMGTTVQPVLCLTGRRVAGRAGQVVVCSTYGLVPMLESRASALAAEDLQRLGSDLRRQLTTPQALRARADRRSSFRLGGRRGSSTG
ncbi:nuclease-related domain-containing protein [Nocardioides rubriscoriae]|uniref:nuclease-related domain-containing protein n=1 Tax=Nocardioides rubriscoriae TaxID=642762 RepID=UPI0014782123|nr:nuclease-related domain-containing protein [Nocardioides rubriscoriae]